jgi:hypothetical protein
MRTPVIDPAWRVDSFPLRGLLYCVCGQPFFPWGWTESRRAYLSLCGCRLRPIDADTTERHVRMETERLVTSSTAEKFGPELFQRLFARVEVGGTVDEVRVVRRV